MRRFLDKKILIADADGVNATVLQMLFERRGGAVTATGDAGEVLDLVRSGGFDLVILENRLRGRSGAQLSREIRGLPGAAGKTPILMLTSDVLPAAREMCMDSGLDGIVAKPVDVKELLRKSERVMEKPCGKKEGRFQRHCGACTSSRGSAA